MLRFGNLSGLLLPALLGIAPGPCLADMKRHPVFDAGGGCANRQCHTRLLEAAAGARGGSAHQPAAAGDCSSCHDLALPAEARFVKGAPPAGGEESGKGRPWDVTLCTGCHGEGLLTPNAPAATGFADGKRNLHTLHVQSGRGRRCLPCHDPHAAPQPKLLRERIPARVNAQIAQEFRAEPRGGRCRTGCHAPKSYLRPDR